ncbi:MAG: PPC domain-containing protein, partial [Bradymonadia bacterium]
MKYSIAVLSFLLMCLGCSSDSGGGDTMMTPGGGQGGAAGGQGGSGGEGGGPPPAMQGGGSLPTDVADCERGCLSARQCDLDECFSDVAGRLVSLCTQACQSGDRAAYANLVGASCPDAGYQAQNLLGITNECTGQSSRCQECAAEEACINGACGVFTCTPDQFDNAGNDATSAEVIDAVDTVLVARSVCTGDEDWYSVNVPAGQNLFIDTVFVHGIGDVDVKVFDGADPAVQLYQSASATDNESLVIPPTNDDRTFLIQVFPFRDAQNTYELHLNFDVPLAICTTNAQCPMGEECNANACAPIPPCFSDDDCGFVTSKCDVGSGICYECLVTEDCPSGVCNNNECVDCIGDGDCEVGRCLENECVECVDNSDCQAGNVCLGSVCGPESCLDSLEPNNSEETAVPINAGSPYDVTICSDKDYYAFSMPQGQAFVVELTFLHGDGDIDATLKQGGETVVSAVSTDDNESLFVPARLAGGDYVLYVRRLGSGAEDRAPDQSYTVFVN